MKCCHVLKNGGQQDKWQGEKAPVGNMKKGTQKVCKFKTIKNGYTEDGCHRQLQTELAFQAEIGVHAAPKNEIDGIQEKVDALYLLF